MNFINYQGSHSPAFPCHISNGGSSVLPKEISSHAEELNEFEIEPIQFSYYTGLLNEKPKLAVIDAFTQWNFLRPAIPWPHTFNEYFGLRDESLIRMISSEVQAWVGQHTTPEEFWGILDRAYPGIKFNLWDLTRLCLVGHYFQKIDPYTIFRWTGAQTRKRQLFMRRLGDNGETTRALIYMKDKQDQHWSCIVPHGWELILPSGRALFNKEAYRGYDSSELIRDLRGRIWAIPHPFNVRILLRIVFQGPERLRGYDNELIEEGTRDYWLHDWNTIWGKEDEHSNDLDLFETSSNPNGNFGYGPNSGFNIRSGSHVDHNLMYNTQFDPTVNLECDNYSEFDTSIINCSTTDSDTTIFDICSNNFADYQSGLDFEKGFDIASFGSKTGLPQALPKTENSHDTTSPIGGNIGGNIAATVEVNRDTYQVSFSDVARGGTLLGEYFRRHQRVYGGDGSAQSDDDCAQTAALSTSWSSDSSGTIVDDSIYDGGTIDNGGEPGQSLVQDIYRRDPRKYNRDYVPQKNDSEGLDMRDSTLSSLFNCYADGAYLEIFKQFQKKKHDQTPVGNGEFDEMEDGQTFVDENENNSFEDFDLTLINEDNLEYDEHDLVFEADGKYKPKGFYRNFLKVPSSDSNGIKEPTKTSAYGHEEIFGQEDSDDSDAPKRKPTMVQRCYTVASSYNDGIGNPITCYSNQNSVVSPTTKALQKPTCKRKSLEEADDRPRAKRVRDTPQVKEFNRKRKFEAADEGHSSQKRQCGADQIPSIPTAKDINVHGITLSSEKRVPNSFLLYRSWFSHTSRAHNSTIKNTEISRSAGEGWRKLSPLEKQTWIERSSGMRSIHKELYPDYQYRPRKSKDIKRRRQNTEEDLPLNKRIKLSVTMPSKKRKVYEDSENEKIFPLPDECSTAQARGGSPSTKRRKFHFGEKSDREELGVVLDGQCVPKTKVFHYKPGELHWKPKFLSKFKVQNPTSETRRNSEHGVSPSTQTNLGDTGTPISIPTIQAPRPPSWSEPFAQVLQEYQRKLELSAETAPKNFHIAQKDCDNALKLEVAPKTCPTDGEIQEGDDISQAFYTHWDTLDDLTLDQLLDGIDEPSCTGI